RHLSTSYFHLFIHSSARHRHLHSFPTRRSSDLAEYDRKLTVHMIRYARDLLRQPLLREYLGEEIFPGHSCLSEEEIINVCRQFGDRKSTRLNSSHLGSSYAVFCLKKKISRSSPA